MDFSLLCSAVESEWLYVPNGVTPPALYFNITKMGAWSSSVDYIEVCCHVTREREREGGREGESERERERD